VTVAQNGVTLVGSDWVTSSPNDVLSKLTRLSVSGAFAANDVVLSVQQLQLQHLLSLPETVRRRWILPSSLYCCQPSSSATFDQQQSLSRLNRCVLLWQPFRWKYKLLYSCSNEYNYLTDSDDKPGPGVYSQWAVADQVIGDETRITEDQAAPWFIFREVNPPLPSLPFPSAHSWA